MLLHMHDWVQRFVDQHNAPVFESRVTKGKLHFAIILPYFLVSKSVFVFDFIKRYFQVAGFE